MATLTIVNPVAKTQAETSTGERFQPAPRPASLDGKTIGLFWNAKGGGEVALARTRENLLRLYPSASFVDVFAAHGSIMRQASTAQVEEVSREVDAIVGTTAD
jgi:hypothetical protein